MSETTVHLAKNPSAAIDKSAHHNSYNDKYFSSKNLFQSTEHIKKQSHDGSYKNQSNMGNIFTKADIQAPQRRVNADYQKSNLFDQIIPKPATSYKNKSDPFAGNDAACPPTKRLVPEYQQYADQQNNKRFVPSCRYLEYHPAELKRPEQRHFDPKLGYEEKFTAGRKYISEYRNDQSNYESQMFRQRRPRDNTDPFRAGDGITKQSQQQQPHIPRRCADFQSEELFAGMNKGRSSKANQSTKENIIGDGQQPLYECKGRVTIDNRVSAFPQTKAVEARDWAAGQGTLNKSKFAENHWK